jgi:hypothetical protein
MSSNVTETSLAAYAQLLQDKKIGKKQVLVLEVIKILQPCSAQDVATYLRQPINVITARLSELHHELKVLRFVGYKDSIFHKEERTYEIGEPDFSVLKPTYKQRLFMIVEALENKLKEEQTQGSFEAMGIEKALEIVYPIANID